MGKYRHIVNGESPVNPSDFAYTNQLGKEIHEMNTGLTKREAFAMAAMQGLLAEAHTMDDMIASRSVKIAEELLKELAK